MTTTTESVRIDPRGSIERVGCRAYLSAEQSNLNGDAWNKINLNAVTYNMGSCFNVSTYKFTAPVSGLYSLSAHLTFKAAGVIADLSYTIALYKNNAAFVYDSATASVAGQLGVGIYDEQYLKKDDYIELYAYPNVGAGTNTVDVLEGTGYTYLICRLVTKEGLRQ